MTEIYRNTLSTITLDIIGASATGTPTATLYKGDDETELTVDGPQQADGVETWEATIGFAQTIISGRIKVVWEFEIEGQPANKVEYYDIVTPYVGITEARDELEIPVNVTDGQIVRAERRARQVINGFCGQSFDLVEESMYVRGTETDVLNLPKRAVEITSLRRDGMLEEVGHRISGSGWSLTRVSAQDTYPLLAEEINVAPIRSPFGSTYRFNAGYWVVEGTFGYQDVPSTIRECTLILIEQYLCPTSIYAERYVEAITGADWRLQFNDQAYSGTGNVIVDQLLEQFVVNRMVIL